MCQVSLAFGSHSNVVKGSGPPAALAAVNVDLYGLLMHWDVLVVLGLLVPLLCSNRKHFMMSVCTFCAQHTCDAAADGRHGHADRSPAALPPAQRPHQSNQQTGETNGTGTVNSHNGQHEEQKGKQEDDEQECGLSLDQLGHENVGSQQALRNEDEQNKFVAGIIRRGLYKEGWKLVITGVPAFHCYRYSRMHQLLLAAVLFVSGAGCHAKITAIEFSVMPITL